MNDKIKISIFLFVALLFVNPNFIAPQTDLTAKEIIDKANTNKFGETSESVMEMTIVRPKWTRSITMKNWTLGKEYSMVLITAPAKEKGQVFLKHENEMWNWIPTISRMIKLPPSMMSQGWMGSDYTNDDMVNEGAIVNEFSHKILRQEKFEGIDCYVIESVPNENSDVIWGKKITWVSKDRFLPLKTESYDEDLYLVKTETASKIQEMGGKVIPTVFTIIPADEPNQKTLLTVKSIIFDKEISKSFFTQQNMKRVK
jgi:outer membrane lipoprotein-sorting protein